VQITITAARAHSRGALFINAIVSGEAGFSPYLARGLGGEIAGADACTGARFGRSVVKIPIRFF
jgi:hypothetical protein